MENPKNALKMGCFTTKKWSKMGQKRICPKVILDHLECSNKCFEPEITRFGPWKRPKCLENGSLWDEKWVKNVFSQK